MHIRSWMIQWYNANGLRTNSRYFYHLELSDPVWVSWLNNPVLSNCRTDNQAMMKLWPWMKHFVRLLSTVCPRLVVGDWVLTDLQWYWPIHRTSRFVLWIYLFVFGVSLRAWVMTNPFVWGGRKFYSFRPWNHRTNRLPKVCILMSSAALPFVRVVQICQVKFCLGRVVSNVM